MLRLTVRLVSIVLLAAPGLLLALTPMPAALPVKPDPAPAAPHGSVQYTFQGTLTGVPAVKPDVKPVIEPKKKDAKSLQASPVSAVSIDAAGFATFTHRSTKVATAGECRLLTFRANDFDDAMRSLKVSWDQVAFAKGSFHPLLPVLRDKKAKDALPGVQLTDLLNSLRGQQVTVSPDGTAASAKTGILLSIDTIGGQSNQGNNSGTPATPPPATPTTPSASKTITLWMKDAGVLMLGFSATTAIKFTDARITNQVTQALAELARGNGQLPRAVVVQLPAGNSTITYSHPIAPWNVQYILTLNTADPADPKAPAKPTTTTATLSARVTVRNSTAQGWNGIDISLTGLPWSASPAVRNVSLAPDEVATFTVSPPAGVVMTIPDDAITFKNQQANYPNPDRKFTIALPKGGLSAIPGPITVVEDGIVAGQIASLDFAGTDAASVTLSPYNLVMVSQSTPTPDTPFQISFADGQLTYTNMQTTTFRLTNRSNSPKTLAVTAQAGWKGAMKEGSVITIPANTTSPTSYSFVEKSPAQGGSLASLTWDQSGAFRKSVDTASGYKILRSLLDQVKAQQKLANTQIADLAGQRQALTAAITAIAGRQPVGGASVLALRVPQMTHDEATVASLRHKMDLIAVKQAEILHAFETFVCEQPPFTVLP